MLLNINGYLIIFCKQMKNGIIKVNKLYDKMYVALFGSVAVLIIQRIDEMRRSLSFKVKVLISYNVIDRQLHDICGEFKHINISID